MAQISNTVSVSSPASYKYLLLRFYQSPLLSVQSERKGSVNHIMAAFTLSAPTILMQTTWLRSLTEPGPFAPILLMSDNLSKISKPKTGTDHLEKATHSLLLSWVGSKGQASARSSQRPPSWTLYTGRQGCSHRPPAEGSCSFFIENQHETH